MPSFNYTAFVSTTGFGLDCCDRKSDELPLMVNCAGFYSAYADFFTDKPSGRDDWYFLYMTGGELEISLSAETDAITGGTAVLIPPHVSYSYSGSDKQHTEYFWVHFTGSSADRILSDFGINSKPVKVNLDSTSRINRLFAKLFEGFYPRDSVMQHRLASTLYEILVLAGGSIDASKQAEQNRLTKSIRYMNEALADRVSVPDLAKIESLSVSRYNTLFRQVTGTSPVQYLLNLRMNTACDLLRATDLTIQQVAERSGYDDARFFSKMFKKTVGLTPTEYRESPKTKKDK